MLKIQFIYLLLLLSGAQAEDKTQFTIGAIFPDKDDEAEIAFQTAIERGNIYERSFELVALVQYGDIEDSFIMERTVCNLIAQGAMAIFGPSTASGSDVVASICSTLDIPHLVYDWSPNEAGADRDHYAMTLNVYPDNLLLSRGIAELVQNFGWRSYTIVYETDKELQQLQDTLQINEPASTPTTIRQLGEDDDHRPFLKSIKMSTDNCLILHCSVDKILHILRQANELKMLGEYQSIFIPNLDTHTLNLDELHDVGANISTIRLMDPTDYTLKSIAHDWEEHEKREERYYRADPEKIKTNMVLINDAITILIKGLKELEIDEKFKPPKVDCRKNRQWPFGKRIIETIRELSEEGATGRVDFNEYGERNFFTIRFMELVTTGFIDLATWNPVNGFDLLASEDDSDKRVGEKLSNKTFIITSRIGAPFLLHREPKEGEILQGNARYEGYSMDLIEAIAQMLNFKYEFHLAPDGKYGGFNKQTQTWDGLVKQLLDGNADLGICDLTMTSARRQAVDFTPPFMTLGISILYSKAEIAPPDLFSFLSPFSLDVWIYMASAYLIISFLLIGLSRMAPEDWENPHPCKEPEELENLWGMMNSTWLTMGSIMGQGCDILPKATSTRLVTGMWWFFALMMLNSYTANLAAFLTQSRMDNSIESAEDLAAQSKIKYGAVIGGSTMSFFRESNFSTFQRMWASMESARPSVFTKSNDEGVERVLKGKRLYAFLMESTTLEYIIERQCELMQVGGWLDYKTYGIAMPFNSPFRKQISGAVLKLGESGTLAELKRKWWKEMHGGGSCSKTESGGGDTPELDLENVGGVFLVLGIGLCSAIILGIAEFLWNLKTVAIEEKITPMEAFKLEAMFALKFWITTKPVRTSSTKSSSSSSSSSTSSSSSNSAVVRSKHSSKSLGLSNSHSMKSIKSLAADGNAEDPNLSVHEKLRKIGSMFSIKSLHSEHATPHDHHDVGNADDDDEVHAKVDKATQIEAQLKQRQHHHHHHQQQHQHQHLENERNKLEV